MDETGSPQAWRSSGFGRCSVFASLAYGRRTFKSSTEHRAASRLGIRSQRARIDTDAFGSIGARRLRP